MSLFTTPADCRFAQAISRLVYANPFLPERIAIEREALGHDFSEAALVWAARPGAFEERPNVALLQSRAETLAAALAPRRARNAALTPEENRLYEDLIQYVLYYRNWRRFDALLANPNKVRRLDFFETFAAEFRGFFPTPPNSPSGISPEGHLCALFFQIRRAFHSIFHNIVGNSMPVAQLRAQVWQSIFTCDLAAYRGSLFDRLDDVPTLITGASGTGKELVARAIALSRYIPFNTTSASFATAQAELFLPLNLSALSPTLIESELFGHRRGAFTGALENRIGWLEHCPRGGAVFLDEIGELDGQIQVKLLRVLQSRTFNRLGETESRPFAGKLIAATNRDLAGEMQSRRFRTDLYYRLCADMITTPTLAQQLAGAPDYGSELRHLVQFIALRVAGKQLADDLTPRVVDFILQNVGQNYSWPGNFRELEQCVRNILIRRHYQPPATKPAATSEETLAAALSDISLTADQLLDRYVAIVYAATGSFQATAKKLNLDRRTVRARLIAAGKAGTEGQ